MALFHQPLPDLDCTDVQRINSNELYVGDLSFFCEEHHLVELFSQFGYVENCRILRNGDRTRSLLFGFIVMSTIDQAALAASALHNNVFMGRLMKVELCAKRRTATSCSSSQSSHTTYLQDGFQIHLSFSSSFHPAHVIQPTETFLGEFFCQFGPIVDVVVRAYTIAPDKYRQEGYGFLTFRDEEAAIRASHHCSPHVNVQGISISAKLSFRNKKTGKLYDLSDTPSQSAPRPIMPIGPSQPIMQGPAVSNMVASMLQSHQVPAPTHRQQPYVHSARSMNDRPRPSSINTYDTHPMSAGHVQQMRYSPRHQYSSSVPPREQPVVPSYPIPHGQSIPIFRSNTLATPPLSQPYTDLYARSNRYDAVNDMPSRTWM